MKKIVKDNKQEFHIVALGAQGEGVSGGDRIFIELARRISKNNHTHIWLSDEGLRMCRRMKLSEEGITYHASNLSKLRRFGPIVYNLALVFEAKKMGIFYTPHSGDIVYSASEFWMDSLPTLFWKLKNKKIRWVASWYQTAPSPLRGFSLTSLPRNRLASIPYWFFQKTTKPYIEHFADAVNVNNKGEEKEFPLFKKTKRVFVMYGAVDTVVTRSFEKKIGKQSKKYDAVFQGRFHPQKGVVELIDIWKLVTEVKPNASLVMIGDGPLMTHVKIKIEQLGLQNNVLLLGYVFDGEVKYKTFMQSRVVVHPAYYDSGGMASAEAMAFGLPGVCFDLPAYEDYYPKGMIKVSIENKHAFASAILELLENKALSKKMSLEAKEMVNKNWSWDKRTADFWQFVINIKA